jgi:hypothetical protein
MVTQTEAQILVGSEESGIPNKKLNKYQLMINWRLELDPKYILPLDKIPEVASRNLAEILKNEGIKRCRVYNGVNYNQETWKFVEMNPLSSIEEITLRQTLKTIGGVLVETA